MAIIVDIAQEWHQDMPKKYEITLRTHHNKTFQESVSSYVGRVAFFLMKTSSVSIGYKEQVPNSKATSVKGSWTTQLILLNYVDYCLAKNSVISTISML